MNKNLILLSLIVLVAGCDSSPRVNGRNPDEFLDSLKEVRSHLTESEVEQFNYGVSAIRTSVEKLGAGLAGGDGSSGAEKRFLERIHGLTGAEVIAEGQRIKRLREEKLQEMFPNAKLGDKS